MNKQKSPATPLDFTPAAPSLRLYDFLVAVLTRENTWRGLLLREMQPRKEDRIADIGCGTASLIKRICQAVSPDKLIGIDPDPVILETKSLFRIVQQADGYEDTQPNADGILPTLMEEAGFSKVQEKHVIQTISGSLSIYCAERPSA